MHGKETDSSRYLRFQRRRQRTTDNLRYLTCPNGLPSQGNGGQPIGALNLHRTVWKAAALISCNRRQNISGFCPVCCVSPPFCSMTWLIDGPRSGGFSNPASLSRLSISWFFFFFPASSSVPLKRCPMLRDGYRVTSWAVSGWDALVLACYHLLPVPTAATSTAQR